MKSFIEMICEADQSEQQVEVRLKEIKDKETPSKTLVGFLKSSNQRVSQAAEEELRRRKQAGEDTAGYEDEDPMTDEEGQPLPPEVEVNTGEELPVNADSIARELNTKVHPDDEKDKKTKQLKIKPNEIVLNPEYQARLGITEAKERSVVFSFGRMNPITVGHEKLVAKIVEVARNKGADAAVFVSSTQDKKKNPLPYDKKLKYAKLAFPRVVRDLPRETKAFGMLVGILKNLDKKYDHLTMVVGSDRVDSMKNLITKYNGKEFDFKSVDVISAGERDPDADDVSGMSASKMRELAKQGDFDAFKQGLPSKLKSSAKSMYDDVRSAMLNEEELSEKVLTVQQRLKKRAVMKRSKGRVKVGQRKAIRRKASGKVIDRRSKRLAIRFMRKRILKGKKYNDLSYSARAAVDRIVTRRAVAIKRIAQRLSPKIRRSESQRKSGGGFKSVSLSPSRKVRKENFERYVDMFGDYMTEQNFLDFVHIAFDDLSEEFTVDMTFSEEQYLMKKAEQTGESFETLKKVFDRGVASWNMGLHEDVTPQQWAFARVNSYINEGASRKTADVDLTEAEMFGISKAISPIIHMHSYKAAKKILQQVWDRKKDEAAKIAKDSNDFRNRGTKHGLEWYAAQIARQYHGVDAKRLAKMINEDEKQDSYGNFIDVAGNRVGIMKTMSFKDFMNTTPKTEEVKEPTGDLKDACWKGYTAVGTKMKNGRKVPNCVPKEETTNESKEDHVRMAYGVLNDKRYKGGNLTKAVSAIEKIKKGLSKHPAVQKAMKATSESTELDEVFASDYSGMSGKFKKSVESAEAAHKKGDVSRKTHHLDSARNRLMGMKSTDMAKLNQTDHYDRYKKMRGLGTKSTSEEYGAGFEGTSGLTSKYKKDTPCQESVELEESTQYKLHHSTYSSAINHALAHHEKRGLKVHDDDRWDKVAVGPRKPSEGKTVSVNIPATHTKTGKKHMVHVQVYNKGGNTPYELNTYSSTHRSMQKEALDKDADAGDYIRDFEKSDAPQFQGKSKEKRRQMAVAAYMSKKNEEVELDEATKKTEVKKVYSKKGNHIGTIYMVDNGHKPFLSGLYHVNNTFDNQIQDVAKLEKWIQSQHERNLQSVKKEHEEAVRNVKKIKAELKSIPEEVELDELSKDTMRSYASKAMGDASKKSISSMNMELQARKTRKQSGESSFTKRLDKASDDLANKAKRRMKFARKALGKLDEGDTIVEAKKRLADLASEYEKLTGKKAPAGTSLMALQVMLNRSRKKVNESFVEESVDKSSPIYKEYQGLMKMSKSELFKKWKSGQRVSSGSMSDFSSKEHLASTILQDKHGSKRMKQVFGESVEMDEATYQGKEVPLNKPMAGDVKKSKVYVDPDGDGNAQKVNFGDKNMTIKKDIPARRKSFRARHKCDTAKDKTTPRYWSCKAW